MPAVDYRIPGGLKAVELSSTLKAALASGKAMGIEITIYNPSLDEGSKAGRALTSTLADFLGDHAPVA